MNDAENVERSKMLAAIAGGEPLEAACQSLTELLSTRYSCRQFLPTPVPQAQIERMIALAQFSPSWCNAQPWEILVTSGNETERLRSTLAAHAATRPAPSPDVAFPPSYHGKFDRRRRETALQLYEAVGIAPGDRAASAAQVQRNFSLFGAPHVMILTTEATLGSYATLDCGIFLGALMLAAQSLGIATIAQAALAMHAGFLRRHFNIADGRNILCGLSFGYPDPLDPANGFRTPRAKMEDVIDWRS